MTILLIYIPVDHVLLFTTAALHSDNFMSYMIF